MIISYRRATEEDIEAIRSLLESQKPPTETVGTTITDFYLAVENKSLVGVAGFEYYGEDALLRSVAVPASFQKEQIGSQLEEYCATHRNSVEFLCKERISRSFQVNHYKRRDEKVIAVQRRLLQFRNLYDAFIRLKNKIKCEKRT